MAEINMYGTDYKEWYKNVIIEPAQQCINENWEKISEYYARMEKSMGNKSEEIRVLKRLLRVAPGRKLCKHRNVQKIKPRIGEFTGCTFNASDYLCSTSTSGSECYFNGTEWRKI